MKRITIFVLMCALALVVNAQHSLDTRVGTAAATTRTAGKFGSGTEEYGHVLPAVLEPFGQSYWTPQTRDTEKKGVCPYYYNDDKLQGFRCSHWLVGGCTQDYGSFTIMPMNDNAHIEPELRAVPFSHDAEVATPSYYSVELPTLGVKCEMTGACHSALLRFTYTNSEYGWLVVNTNSDEGVGTISVDGNTITGSNPVHRIYQGWGDAAGFSGWFTIKVNADIVEAHCDGSKYAYVKVRIPDNHIVMVKAASSFVSIAGAERNLAAEIPAWDFEEAHRRLADKWQARFGKIEVDCPSMQEKNMFEEALYHASFLPRTMNDVDGSYPRFADPNGGIEHMPEGKNYYCDFSVWDIYRAQMPLLTILNTDRMPDMMQSLVLKAEQGGWMPIFPCWNSYTAAMIGDHCTSLIAEAYGKGIRGFDAEKAYQYLRKNAFDSPATFDEYKDGKGRRALKSYLQYGYIPLEDSVKEAFHTNEQVSRTLEYSYDDYALAQLAKALGHKDDYKALMQRSKNYTKVFDPKTGWVQGRHENGTFATERNYDQRISFITEGAPCHYSWYVPHDVPGLIKAMGGKKRFVEKLDSMFSEGLYWHGNEPCHQVAYMYALAGHPERTQDAVRNIMDTEYNYSPGGLAGNDDAGQMSAWYIFSALGFYPVSPVDGEYVLGAPRFSRAVINLPAGKQFVITATNLTTTNRHVKHIKLNGKRLSRPFITHKEIMDGGTLEFVFDPS